VRAKLPGEVAELERPASMARMILDRVAATPDREAYRYPDGDRWASLDWRRVGEWVDRRW
jgi:long-chain acyl-CoA synthetase